MNLIPIPPTIGLVIIGRNEGDRLRTAILSGQSQVEHIVYVDSGSTDGSVELAQELGCEVVNLDLSKPFTAARGRNEGWQYLFGKHPETKYIQFIDGDCELDPSWISNALRKIESDEQIAIVCGRRRERFPNESIYNKMCDMEWDTPIGEAMACGGDSLTRVDALREVNGYNPTFAAGEEPEMCYRMRQLGWKIWRIDEEMTMHDADMTTFSQWWQRTKRSGSAYAQSAWTHGRGPERYNVKDCLRIWLWGGFVPLFMIFITPFTLGTSLLLLAGLYGYLGRKVYKYRLSVGDPVKDARIYAVFNVIGKFPQLIGQLKFFKTRESKLIEYKG